MVKNLSSVEKICIATGYTDLRRGIDGLVSIIQSEFELNPVENYLFLFCGRRLDRRRRDRQVEKLPWGIKALYWDENGFILLYKRLESGKSQWPRSDQEAKLISPQQYRWLMEGLKVEQKTALKPTHKFTDF